VRRTLDLRTELMLSEELSVSLVFGAEKVIPATDSTTVAQVVGTNETTGGIEIQYDTRDDFYSPESGARYRTDYHYGRKSIGSVPAGAALSAVTGGTVQRLGVDLEFFLPAFRRQVVAFGLHGREIRTGQVQQGEMYQFGGANTLRGYRENQFIGAEIAWTNAEYRFILARRSFLFGFLDTGTITVRRTICSALLLHARSSTATGSGSGSTQHWETWASALHSDRGILLEPRKSTSGSSMISRAERTSPSLRAERSNLVYEDSLRRQGLQVAGIDEAGRGPLAGRSWPPRWYSRPGHSSPVSTIRKNSLPGRGPVYSIRS